MRKHRILVSTLIAAALCFILTGCRHSDSIYGKWKGYSAIYKGKEYSLSYMSEHHDDILEFAPASIFGVEAVELILTKSGNAKFTNSESNTIDCCFTLQDSILELYLPSDKADSFLLEYDGKSIRYVDDDITYILTK